MNMLSMTLPNRLIMKNNKGGRPPKKQGKKDQLVQFWVTREQFRVLRGFLEASRYHGMGELLRSMVFDKRIRVTTENANARELQYELAKIGNNINQIAKRCNIDTVGGQPARLKLSDKYIISKAASIIEEAIKKGMI